MMKIRIFEENSDVLRLLTLIFEKKGHQVQGISDGFSCSSCIHEKCSCPPGQACVDAVLINARQPLWGTLQSLMEQDQKGCKLAKEKKAIMCTHFTDEQILAIRDSGFAAIKKPFTISKIVGWLAPPE
jgi:DNA-binding NtrC family response regulator